MPVGETYRWVLHGEAVGQNTQNIFWLESFVVEGSGASDEEIGEAAFNHITPNLSLALSNTAFLRGWTISRVAPTLGQTITRAQGPAQGSIAGDAMPALIAAVVAHTTPIGGRRQRGRSFIGGLPESGCDGNFLLVAQRNLLNNFAQTLTTDVVAGLLPNRTTLSWMHRTVVGNSFSQITGATTRSLIATMRSRKPGRGTVFFP